MSRNPVLILIALLLAAPLAVFNLTFLTPLPAAATTCGLVAGIFLLVRGMPATARPDVRANWRAISICVAVGFAVVLIGGEGRFFFATDDWIIRDAVMGDLVKHNWPIAYERAGSVAWLRAPLGLYLVPAIIGKAGGMSAAWAALIAQNGLLTGFILYGLIGDQQGRTKWVSLAVFVMFSGCDLIAWCLEYPKQPADYVFDTLDMHYGKLMYVSHISQMFWAPHHSLAGWGFVAGYVAWRSQRLSAGGLASIFALMQFWSPLAGVGAFPFLVFAGVSDIVRRRLRWNEFAAPILCGFAALFCFAYMINDSSTVDKGWAFLEPEFLSHYGELIGLEVLPFLLFVWISPGALRAPGGAFDSVKLAEFALIGAILVVLPFYWINFTNDILLRASIPALALLALKIGPMIAVNLRDGFGSRRWIVPVLLIGAATPVTEIIRNIVKPATPASSCNLLDAWDTGPWRMWPLSAYLADHSAFDRPAGLWREPASLLRADGRICPWEKPGT